jgi:hypothetical protein
MVTNGLERDNKQEAERLKIVLILLRGLTRWRRIAVTG